MNNSRIEEIRKGLENKGTGLSPAPDLTNEALSKTVEAVDVKSTKENTDNPGVLEQQKVISQSGSTELSSTPNPASIIPSPESKKSFSGPEFLNAVLNELNGNDGSLNADSPDLRKNVDRFLGL